MPSREVDIVNRLGLHARAAAKLVATASEHESRIEIEYNDQRVNAKSIMGVMMLAAACGARVTLHAEGEDAEQALARLAELVEQRFGEPE
ncbi:MAG: HPr family phosphocarrier protein [Gammaproteobacteria bacterium]|nr:MAG: HPr family phosphocarrier protein [Gammaproteobacteria bacterium]